MSRGNNKTAAISPFPAVCSYNQPPPIGQWPDGAGLSGIASQQRGGHAIGCAEDSRSERSHTECSEALAESRGCRVITQACSLSLRGDPGCFACLCVSRAAPPGGVELARRERTHERANKRQAGASVVLPPALPVCLSVHAGTPAASRLRGACDNRVSARGAVCPQKRVCGVHSTEYIY